MELSDGRRIAKIYFCRGNEQLVKDMAASIRNQKSHAHLIDQQHFTGPETVLAANAVLIQANAPKARLIANSYAEYGTPGVEVLFFDGEGKITELDIVEPEKSFASMLGAGESPGDQVPTPTEGEGDDPENNIERASAELLEDIKPAKKRRTRRTKRSADIEDGNSAGNAENTES